MSEEKNEKNTVSDAENTQNAPEIEDKEELITADSLDKMMEELKEEADGSVQTPPVKAEKPAVTETSENVKKYKLFFVSDMDEEAEFLHKMSKDGLHFVSKNGIQYLFKKGEPKIIIITLDIMKKIFVIRNNMLRITKRLDGIIFIMKRESLTVCGIISEQRWTMEQNQKFSVTECPELHSISVCSQAGDPC